MDEQPRGRTAPGRARGLRQVRRWSNGTAAALIAATALTAGYFARASGPAAAGQPAQVAGPQQPCISVPVATSGGSGVTRQTVIRSCGTGGGGSSSAPVVITTGRSGEGGDN